MTRRRPKDTLDEAGGLGLDVPSKILLLRKRE